MRKITVTATVMICLLGTLMFAGCKKSSEEENQEEEKAGVILDEALDESSDASDAEATEGQQNVQMQEGQTPPETEEDGGGNEFSTEKKEEVTKISVLVNKEEYICDNTPMELDEIISKVQEVKGKIIVEVSENDATLKAYNKLMEKFEELDISVIEK